MDVEACPAQPEEVVEAIAAALEDPPSEPDPWWRAGVEEALGE